MSPSDFSNRWQSLAGASPRVPLTERRLVEKPCLYPLKEYSCGNRTHIALCSLSVSLSISISLLSVSLSQGQERNGKEQIQLHCLNQKPKQNRQVLVSKCFSNPVNRAAMEYGCTERSRNQNKTVKCWSQSVFQIL